MLVYQRVNIVSHINFDIWLVSDGFSRIRCWSGNGQQNETQSPGLVWICETLRSRFMYMICCFPDIITYYRYVFDVMYAHIYASAYTHTVYRYSCILTYVYIYISYYIYNIIYIYMYTWCVLCINMYQLVHHPQKIARPDPVDRKLKSRRRSKDLCLRDLSVWMPFWWETRLQMLSMLSVLENGKNPENLSGQNGPGEMVQFHDRIFVGGVCPISWQVGVLFLAIDWNVLLFFEHADTWFRNQVLQGLL